MQPRRSSRLSWSRPRGSVARPVGEPSPCLKDSPAALCLCQLKTGSSACTPVRESFALKLMQPRTERRTPATLARLELLQTEQFACLSYRPRLGLDEMQVLRLSVVGAWPVTQTVRWGLLLQQKRGLRPLPGAWLNRSLIASLLAAAFCWLRLVHGSTPLGSQPQ